MPSPEVDAELERHAATAGVDANVLRKFVGNESSGDVNAKASTSSAQGLFQFLNGTWNDLSRRYDHLALNNRRDPNQQARVAPYYLKEIRNHLKASLKRDPDEGEQYLGWVLGPVGASTALGYDDDTPVTAAVSPDALVANREVFNKARTVGELRTWAASKMGGSYDPKPVLDLTPYLNQPDKSHLDNMNPALRNRIGQMLLAMPENLRKQFKINSGARTPERQAELMRDKIKDVLGDDTAKAWVASVAEKGPVTAGQEWHERLQNAGITKWVGLPGGSNHNKGTAADINTKDPGELRDWVHANAGKFGLNFPMAHEPWHIEVLGSLATKQAKMGMAYDPSQASNRNPYSFQDEFAARRAKEENSYSLIQAAAETAKLDWSISNLLKSQGKSPYDPNWVVTADDLRKDPRAEALPANYLTYLARSTSQQDFEFKMAQAQKDWDSEQKLANTDYGLGVRLAVGMADPLGLLLSAVSPLSLAAKAGQAGRAVRLAAAAGDGAIGAVAAELPLAANKPGYEMENMLYAAAIGAGGYVALNRSWARDPDIAPDAEQFLKTTQRMQQEHEAGGFGSSSAGAAQSKRIEAVIGDADLWSSLPTEQSGAKWMEKIRFDFGNLKNSKNPVVAAVADRLGVDGVGNRDKTKAVRRAIEEDKRFFEQRPNIEWARHYEVQAETYRERNKISFMDWQNGAEDEFQRKITHAQRNTDPLATFDPEVEAMAGVWKNTNKWWVENAQNPGKLSGETLRPIPGAEMWDDPNYVPRFINWDNWKKVSSEIGPEGLKTLLRKSIAAKNPDMDPELAHKLGGWYYDRIRNVQAGQEMTASRVFSGLDVEMMRKSLVDDLGLSEEEVGKVLYQATARDESKGLSNRQKARQHMDENFSLYLNGRNVAISEIWEDNSRAIIHAYNSQMAGTVAMARFRIENPNFKPGVDPEESRFLVDGIHKDADWQDLLKKARAVDDDLRNRQLREDDDGQGVESEIKNLQWMYENIVGIPNSFDRSKLGQYARIIQGINFMRLMPQAGFASVAEVGMVTASTGWKHTLKSIPGIRDFKRNALDGKLVDDLEDWEYMFMVGTDHLRGTGMTFKSNNQATGSVDPGMSKSLDKVERVVQKGSRLTSMMSLAPVTTFEERLAMKAVLSKFREVANGKGDLRARRMRLLGLDPAMQKRVLEEIKKNSHKLDTPEGRSVEVLGLDKWDEQVRSSFELAVNRWVRRSIQQNDMGQMNHMLGHPIARIFTQFRSFSLAAYSKNTLSNIHMRDWESMNSVLAASAFGGLAYITQVQLNSLGLSDQDRKKFLEDRLSDKKIAGALFQRTGFSSILPGMIDFGGGLLGMDPLFDTRSTGQPTQGLAGANPTFGLIDGVYRTIREGNQSLAGESYTGDDFRKMNGAINPFSKYPLLLQMINTTSGAFPEE